ncbi:MAG: GNAT family N-acetyltransferase [Leptospiraceae bacterium]|nr:GNAT family N-acetyltransferase [Leptospiraceae bacterium]MCP5496082.1 GNAT family N-acetyltransferase [Leptospiraceae bacterium]
MAYKIREFQLGDEIKASTLVEQVFDEFVAPLYKEKGVQNFKDFIFYTRILERQKKGNRIFLAEKEIGKELIGLLELRDYNHISLLFVKPEWQKMGIAKMLFDQIKPLSLAKGTEIITVNSSPNAFNIYKKLGFQIVGKELEKDGIRFIPMKFKFNRL